MWEWWIPGASSSYTLFEIDGDAVIVLLSSIYSSTNGTNERGLALGL